MKRLSHLILLFALLTPLSATAGDDITQTGVRIPHIYFVTTGTGQSNDGVPPVYYETFSYDEALLDAKIADFNIMEYTSVLPKDAVEISIAEAKKGFVHGAVLESIMAKTFGTKGDILVAGIGRIWAKDSTGNFVGGYAAEYSRVFPVEYNLQYGSPDLEYIKIEAKKQLTKSMMGELNRRGLKEYVDKVKKMTFDITSINVTENYGVALAVLGFVNFKYAPPIMLLE
ncbi:MAG: pyruvoyl-dependent arginine decarboxylase [Desulfobacteraceae bacterium]|nr:pyruvoyl-dependent arginine decarboxylase [Desulfobacteraceae bacterium]